MPNTDARHSHVRSRESGAGTYTTPERSLVRRHVAGGFPEPFSSLACHTRRSEVDLVHRGKPDVLPLAHKASQMSRTGRDLGIQQCTLECPKKEDHCPLCPGLRQSYRPLGRKSLPISFEPLESAANDSGCLIPLKTLRHLVPSRHKGRLFYVHPCVRQ